MDIFEDVKHRLSSKTRIRLLFKNISLETMERIIERLNDVLEEKKKIDKLRRVELQEKKNNIEEIKKMLASKGLSLSDLKVQDDLKPRKRRNVHKFTFEYKTQTGNSVRWYGSTTGRLPKEFQVYLEETGKKRLDCIVEDFK